MKSINRRNFLIKSSAGIAGLSLASNSVAKSTLNNYNIPEVIKRKLGNTGIEVPVLSIGCGQVDSEAVIKAALKIGISHFDTANRYQQGNSEKLLGETLKNIERKTYTIATKVPPQKSVEEFIEILNTSLDRLQTEYVDILYIHGLSSREMVLNDICLESVKKAKELGKARFVGVSTHKNEPEVIQAVIDSNTYDIILTAINFKQEHHLEVKEKLAIAAKKGIGVVAMKVMAGGFLDKEKTKPINHVAALKWILQDENIHTTIPSMVNLEQLQTNMAILSNTELTDQENKDLAIATLEQGLYCNACESCIPTCKKLLPIPELMRAYMYSYGYRSALKAKELISELNLGTNPCSDCEYCTVKCIKNFDITHKIHDISQLSNIPNQFLV